MLQESIKALKEERENSKAVETENRNVTPNNNSPNDQILIVNKQTFQYPF